MGSCDSNCDDGMAVTQGITWTRGYQWQAEPIVYGSVSAVVALTPLTLTVTAHGAPEAWSIAVTGLPMFRKGQVNATEWPPCGGDLMQATALDANTLVFNEVNGGLLNNGQPYVSGASIGYYTPVSLTGGSAVYNIYALPAPGTCPPNPPAPLVPILSVNATLDTVNFNISITLTEEQTAALPVGQFTTALVYTDADDNVTELATETMTVGVLGAPQ